MHSTGKAEGSAQGSSSGSCCASKTCGKTLGDTRPKISPPKVGAVAENSEGCKSKVRSAKDTVSEALPKKKGCCKSKSCSKESSVTAPVPEKKGCCESKACSKSNTGAVEEPGNKGCCKSKSCAKPAVHSEPKADQDKSCCESQACSKSGLTDTHAPISDEPIIAKCCEELDCTHNIPPVVAQACEDKYHVSSLCCSTKAKKVESDLRAINGVLGFHTDIFKQELFIRHTPGANICSKISELLDGDKLPVAIEAHTSEDSDLHESHFRVEGLCCSSEAAIIEKLTHGKAGIERTSVNVTMQEVKIKHYANIIDANEIANLLNTQSLGASIISTPGVHKAESLDADGIAKEDVAIKNLRGSRRPSWNVLLAALCWILSLLHYVKDPEWMENLRYLGIGSVLLCLPPILIKAAQRCQKCVLDINMLMSLAVFGAVALGDFVEAAAVVTLFSLSEWLEKRATQRVRDAMGALFDLNPSKAVLAEDVEGLGSQGEQVEAQSVPVGTLLSVKPGEKFPLDGVVQLGSTFADESALTGEARPIRKERGSAVAGGTVNLGTYVEVVSDKKHEDSAVSRMIRLVEEASSARAPTQQLIDKVARIYTPIVFMCAILIATIPYAWGTDTGDEYLHIALVLLVVACPCALVISTPITYVCGLAHAAQKGILIKGGRHLETLGRMKTLGVDKTGTMTKGKFDLIDMKLCQNAEISIDQVCALVAAAQRGSSHPIASAFTRAAKEKGLLEKSMLLSLETLPGQGVKAKMLSPPRDDAAQPEQLEDELVELCCGTHGCSGKDREFDLFIGNTRMADSLGWTPAQDEAAQVEEWKIQRALTTGWIGTKEKPLAYFCVGDSMRDEAPAAIEKLKHLDINVIMLTGDNESAASAVARQVGIQEYHAALLPEDKASRISKIDGVVAMVGDGVNDAPALAAADVSISLGCIGSAVALETADVALMQDDLNALVNAVRLGKKCHRKIWQNVVFSIVSKLIVLIITLTVFSSLWLAIFVDVGSMLIVTLNSMTILGKKMKTPKDPVLSVQV